MGDFGVFLFIFYSLEFYYLSHGTAKAKTGIGTQAVDFIKNWNGVYGNITSHFGVGCCRCPYLVISGFYMALILNEKYAHSYSLFITNRFLRIYPLYFLVLALTLIFHFLFYPHPLWITLLSQNEWSPFLLIMILANLLIFGQDVLILMGGLKISNFMFIPQAWTLSLELMFYLLAPFLVRMRRRYLLCIFMASALLRIFLLYYDLRFNEDPWTYRFFPIELAFFILGIFSYKVYQRLQGRRIPLALNVMVFILVLALTIFFDLIPFSSFLKALLYLLILGAGLPFIFYLTRGSRFDRWIGEYSYAIYVTHMLLMMVLAGPLKVTGRGDPHYGWWVSAGSFFLSFILLNFVIYPIERWRQHRVLEHKL
ncbi:MAG: acyltransferase [Candidatus Omnitrophica bacterium]|nr:acyltransferase [Candidatus Omnitrophota bacterium]